MAALLTRWHGDDAPVLWGRLAALSVLAVLIALIWLLDRSETGRHRLEERGSVTAQVSAIAGRMEEVFNARIHLVDGLAALVRARNGQVSEDEFRLFAAHLRHDADDIRSLQLAPDAVVTHVYPLETNRAAIGHDIRADPTRSVAVERAIRDRHYVIAGPFTLIQGGEAVVARLPVFLHQGEDERFWGFSTVILDLTPLLRAGGVFDSPLALVVRGRDGLGAAGEVFYGDPAVLAADPVTADVKLPNGSWQVAAVPAGGWPTRGPSSWAIWSVGLLLAAISAVFAFQLASAPARLRLAVNRATEELQRSRRDAEAASCEADRANQAKGRFLAAASHDLRQPMQALNLFAAALRKEIGSERGRCLLERVDAALTSMSGLMTAILDISKMDAGLVVPKREPFPLAPLLATLVAEAEPIAAAKGLSLRLVPTAAWVDTDAALVTIILRNLLQNACKYTKAGGIRVGVRRRHGLVWIAVVDTGVGIAPPDLAAVFEEYRQLDNPARNSAGGLGLGLAIVERLARILGHRLTVQSQLGRGSCFALGLPPCAPAQPVRPAAAAAMSE